MSEQPTNRLRTPAQVVAALHVFNDRTNFRYYPEALPEDVAFLKDVAKGQDDTGDAIKAAEVAYLQSIEIDRWTRTEDALPARQAYCLIGLLPKWQDRLGEQPLRAIWWEEHQFWDSDATGRLYPADVVYWQYVPSLPAAASHATPDAVVTESPDTEAETVS